MSHPSSRGGGGGLPSQKVGVDLFIYLFIFFPSGLPHPLTLVYAGRLLWRFH